MVEEPLGAQPDAKGAADVDHPHHVLAADPGGRACLAQKALNGEGVLAQLRREKLHRHLLAVLNVLRGHHHGHAAGPHWLAEQVFSQQELTLPHRQVRHDNPLGHHGFISEFGASVNKALSRHQPQNVERSLREPGIDAIEVLGGIPDGPANDNCNDKIGALPVLGNLHHDY